MLMDLNFVQFKCECMFSAGTDYKTSVSNYKIQLYLIVMC